MTLLICRILSGVGNGNLLQYSCLDNPMDRGDLRAIVLGVAKSQTRLVTNAHMNTYIESKKDTNDYLQNRNRHTDTENNLQLPKGKEGKGIN